MGIKLRYSKGVFTFARLFASGFYLIIIIIVLNKSEALKFFEKFLKYIITVIFFNNSTIFR